MTNILPLARRREVQLGLAVLASTLVGLGFFNSASCAEPRAARAAASLISNSEWNQLYSIELPEEREMLGWSSEQFKTMINSLDAHGHVAIEEIHSASCGGSSRPGDDYAFIVSSPGPLRTFHLHLFAGTGGYHVAIGDVPYQFARSTSKNDSEILHRLADAMDRAQVTRLVNVSEMLVMDRSEIQRLIDHQHASGENGSSGALWYRLSGF